MARPGYREDRHMAMVGCEGIVLRVRDFNEADRILTILSPTEGKFEAVARGARRPRSGVAGTAQLFTRANMMLFRGRSIDTLSSAEVVSSHSRIRSDLVSMAYGSYVAELADAMTAERQPDDQVYSLVCATFAALDRREAPAAIIALGFEVKFLSLIGFKPEVAACVSCRAPEAETAWFGPAAGGLLCDRCRRTDAGAVPMDRDGRRLLRALMARPYARLCDVDDSIRGYGAVADGMRQYVDLRVERRLRTLEFINHVTSMGREDAASSEGRLGPD